MQMSESNATRPRAHPVECRVEHVSRWTMGREGAAMHARASSSRVDDSVRERARCPVRVLVDAARDEHYVWFRCYNPLFFARRGYRRDQCRAVTTCPSPLTHPLPPVASHPVVLNELETTRSRRACSGGQSAWVAEEAAWHEKGSKLRTRVFKLSNLKAYWGARSAFWTHGCYGCTRGAF